MELKTIQHSMLGASAQSFIHYNLAPEKDTIAVKLLRLQKIADCVRAEILKFSYYSFKIFPKL